MPGIVTFQTLLNAAIRAPENALSAGDVFSPENHGICAEESHANSTGSARYGAPRSDKNTSLNMQSPSGGAAATASGWPRA